jgi:succinyl-diaminopimelate desuccinylase
MVHSDVQPVNEANWKHDPWLGQIVEGKLWGRGALDDKGPLAVIMYAMRALLDTGLSLNRKIILLVGTDEESANEDVSTYLQTNKAPDQTIVVDYGYPVICAEKGWCGTWLRLARRASQTFEEGFLIRDLQAGFSPAIVPGSATATLQANGMSPSAASARLLSHIADFQNMRNHGQIEMTKGENDLFTVTAMGRQVHSMAPETGHNALMDLVMFLDRFVQPIQNDVALMVKFAATFIGFELDGRSLGIRHEDDFMGKVTVAANMFHTESDTIMFMFNYRIPKGIALSKIEIEIKNRITQFEAEFGVSFREEHYLSEPHYIDPKTPFVQELLSLHNEVIGSQHQPQSLAGGTYARRLPNAVVFGPKMPHGEYVGHQPNEYLSLATLEANIDILTHVITHFGLQQ